jgi:hypothetical protein
MSRLPELVEQARSELCEGLSRKELERLAWKHKHKDAKGVYGGQKVVLVLGPKGTTMKALSDMTDDELLNQIPSKFRPTEAVRDDFYEGKLGSRANDLAKRYVRTWQKGKGKDDPAVPAIIKELIKLLKDAESDIKKMDKTSVHNLTHIAHGHAQHLKRLKPGKMSDSDFKEIGRALDDLRMWFG